MSICYIFGALETKDLPYIPNENDYIVAADKGLNSLRNLGIDPDIIIGDFDSLGFIPKGENVKVLPVKKDYTDVGFAVNYAFDLGFNEFIIYGAIGELLDHTVANLQLASYISKRGGKAVFVGENVFVTAITNSSLKILEGIGRISIFSYGERACGVSVTGLKYTLENAELTNDFPIGVSNEFDGKDAIVSVENGTLLIISNSKI